MMGNADAPVDILDDLNREIWEIATRELPSITGEMIKLHLTKPWIPDFKSIVIAPLRPDLDEFLAAHIFDWEGYSWYYPTMDWWLAHAHLSHPSPRGYRGDGAGCSVEAHVEFLTPPDGEFAYANILKNGDAYILDGKDFEQECEFFRNFGPRPSQSSLYSS